MCGYCQGQMQEQWIWVSFVPESRLRWRGRALCPTLDSSCKLWLSAERLDELLGKNPAIIGVGFSASQDTEVLGSWVSSTSPTYEQ